MSEVMQLIKDQLEIRTPVSGSFLKVQTTLRDQSQDLAQSGTEQALRKCCLNK